MHGAGWEGRGEEGTGRPGVPGLSTPTASPSERMKQEEDPIKVFLGQSADLWAAAAGTCAGQRENQGRIHGGILRQISNQDKAADQGGLLVLLEKQSFKLFG